MILDDGVTPLEFDPIEQALIVEDRAKIHEAHNGRVIAVTTGGLSPRRTRTVGLRLTAAELADFRALYDGLAGATLQFTDTVGRVWNAQWQGNFDAVEDAYTSVGHYILRITLLLDGVADDADRAAYANVDVSQMSIQKSGAGILYFPLAYAPELQTSALNTARQALTPGYLSVDDGRFLARGEKLLRFDQLPDAFISELEDYYAETLMGAVYPFTLTHFRDGAGTFRWTGGMSCTQGDNLNWSGTLRVLEEV